MTLSAYATLMGVSAMKMNVLMSAMLMRVFTMMHVSEIMLMNNVLMSLCLINVYHADTYVGHEDQYHIELVSTMMNVCQ